jgi:hypothetical protein
MSWDLFVMALPAGILSLKDLPPDYRPPPLGTRSEIIAKISSAFPQTDFSDPSWGTLDVPGCHIEFNMGSDREINNFAMHARGAGKACPDTAAAILTKLNMRAIDPGSESGLFEQDPNLRYKSFEHWQSFGFQVHDSLDKKK